MSKKNQNTEVIRTVCQEVQTCIAGLKDVLEEPLKAQFEKADATICTVLAGLTDDDKTAAEANETLVSTLQATQAVNAALAAALKAEQEQLQTTKASLTDEITKAITAKVTAGELIEKATFEQKINDATTVARTAILAEQKILSERRQQLTTASIPVPGDELLAGDEKEFEARKATAAKRLEDLKKFGLTADRQVALAWNTDAAAYDAAVALMNDVMKAAAKPGGANGFIHREGSGETQPTNKPILC